MCRPWLALAALAVLTTLSGLAHAADVQVSSFTDSPDPGIRGGTITYTITAENSDADVAANVVVTLPLPPNTVFVSAADTVVAGACVHDGLTPGTVTCSYASLLGTLGTPPGPVRTINVVIRTTGASVTTLASTVTVTTSSADTNPANNTLSQNTTINNGADLTATMSGAPNPATGGGLVTWTVSGSNLGPNASGGATYTSTLPGVLSYVATGSGGNGWSCGAAGQVVSCTRAPIAVGAYGSLAIVTAITGVTGGTVTLSGSISSTVGDPDPSNDTAIASVTVNPGADLAVTQDPPSPDPATAGNAVTFVLRPSNGGPNAATAGANVVFALPAGFPVTSATGSAGWACASAGSPAIVTCTFAGSLASGASGVLTIVATAPSVATPTLFSNITATIAPNSSGPADPNAANNTATRTVTVAPDGADLSITKSKTPSIVAQGALMTSTIVVANGGPRTAASGTITVTDALDPTKEAFAGFSGANWACVSAPPNVVCTYNAALGIGNSSTLTITTTALGAGTATNNATASYSGSPGDPNSANDTIAATVTITATNNSPDLLVGFAATTAGGVPTRVEFNETQITYTATLTNKLIGTAANAQNVVVTLSIPGRTTGTTVSVTGQVLTNTSGTSTATFSCAGTGSGSVANVVCTQTGGTILAPGDVVTFTITADRPMLDVTNVNATLSAASTTQGDPQPADNSTSVPITIDPIADVEAVSKVVTPTTVLAGTNATYTLTLRNNGPSPAAAMSMADVFTIPGGDSGFTFISAVASNAGNCSGLTAGTSYTSGTPTLNCSWAADVPSGNTRTVTVVVRPNWQAGAAVRTLGNVATVSTTTPEDSVGGQGAAANSKAATLTINPAQVDVLINNTDSPDPLGYDPVTAANNDVTYTVASTNSGPSLATGTGFTFTMTPPAGRTITFRGDGAATNVAATNPSGVIAGSQCNNTGNSITGPATLTVTCTYVTAAPGSGQLANGSTQTRYLVFRVASAPNTGGDVYTTVATVIQNETDINPANDSEGEQTTVRVRADLAIVKTPSVNPAQLRQPFNWSIVVTNGGPGDSQATGLTDTLPAGMAFNGTPTYAISGGGGTGTCPIVGQTLTCTFGTLVAGRNATVTVPVIVGTYPAGGTTQNCATATTSEVDPNSANNLSICTNVTVQRSSLAGTVFQDRDRVGANAGTPQAAVSEPRIAGVAMQLTGIDAYGNAVSLSTTTDASGNYSFTDLSPAGAGGYLVAETQPAGFVNGPAAPPAPAAGGSYVRGSLSGDSSWTTIALAGNTAGTSYDFPEVRRPSLSGFVYLDVNANGTRDGGDSAITGATVRLLDAGTLGLIATATTDGTGAYTFAGLDPLTAYALEEPLPSTPANLRNGAVNPGLVGGAACASGCTAQPDTPAAGTDRIAAIDLGAGTDGTLFNFGEQQQTTLSGLVFVDANRNNALDGSDTGRVAGVTIRLVQGADCASGTTVQTTATLANGSYAFANILAFQNYLVCETQPAGYGTGSANGTAGSNVITITNLPSGGSTNNIFGETLAQISGSVYADNGAGTPANFNNGVRDAGEAGIANVPVTLTGSDQFGTPVSLTTTTDASGNYFFDGLFPPNGAGYTISEGAIPPASGSFLQGRDTAGPAGGNVTVQDVVSAVALTAGQLSPGYLFGELPNAAISGTVYVDRNRNNTLDATPTDGRLAGVTVRLVTGADCASGTTLQSTTTIGDGSYAFAAVAGGGTYLVCETQPAGYANGTENPGTNGTSTVANTIVIVNLPASGSGGNHFGERVAGVAGSVYQDYSPATPANTDNGGRDAGELGIANVPVTLSGRDVNNAVVNLSTTTDAAGNWRFDDLLQSDATGYTVTEGAIPPASGIFNDGRDTAGSAGGSTAVNDRISGVVLPAGTQATGYLFGELPIAPISGTVYLDRNRNGAIDATPTDGRIAGVTVTLRNGGSCAGAVLATTTTDAIGNYAFSGISAGSTVTVCETQPIGYAEGSVNPGASGVNSAANAITITNLPAAGSAGNHFGERAGSLAGNVFLDANNDGLRAGDAPIAGVTLTLSGVDAAGAPVSRSTVSDGSGAWRFDDVLAAGPAGYTVTEQAAQPVVAGRTTLNGRTVAGSSGGTASAVAATPSAIAAIALAAGADAIENNFAEILPVSIAGTVFIDLNNNGVQNLPADAGIGAVALVITGTDDTGAAVTRNFTTATNGSYAIVDLRPGTYTVTEPTQPTGTTNGQTIAGSAGGTATPVATLPSAISVVVLTTPGASATGYNFAEIPNTSAVSGRVWLDADNNGLIDGAEAGIAGIVITLSGTDLGGAAVSRTTVTDATGNYAFANLAPGTYAVAEPTQPPATLNGTTVAGSAGGTATGAATTPSAITGIVLGVGATSSANNFGELPTASISGRVISDSNNNGRLDAGESGIANVTVALGGTNDLGAAVSATTTTDAAGAYAFTGLRPGTYTVTEPTQPPGTVNGITTAGSVTGTTTGTATPPTSVPSAVAGIVLPPGGASTGNDFAEIGNSPDLLVTKSAVEARFTVNNVGSYLLRVRNGGEIATSATYTVHDRLPNSLTLDATPTGTGWACVGAIGASNFTCTTSDVIAAGATHPNAITARVRIAAFAAANSPAINAVLVDGGGELPARAPSPGELDAFNNTPGNLPACNPAITQNACRTATPVQAAASISGTVWYDVGSARGVLDGADRRLAGWQVEVLDAGGTTVARAVTAADGSYRIVDLLPGIELHVRFRDPASNVVWGYPVNGESAPGSSGAGCNTAQAIANGTASSCAGAGIDPSLTVVLAAGQNLPQQSLPVDPSGVVYDSGTRQPVPGSVVTLTPVGGCAGWNPATGLVTTTLGGYSIAGGAVSMTVGADGFYQFLFAPAAPASCTFSLAVVPPTGYTFVSALIPPAAGPLGAAGAPGSTTLVQPQAGPPSGAVGAATTYYLTLVTGSASGNVIHNHLPVDPPAPTGLSLAKTGDRQVVELGDSLRYTITVQRSGGPVPRQVTVVDRLPAGFTFIAGTAVVNGASIADPIGKPGPVLAFHLGAMSASGQLVLQYRVRIGVGAQQGDGINRAVGYGCGVPAGCVGADGRSPLPGSSATNEGRFQVRITGGVFTTEACVLGKVFVDCNGNHVQDAEEIGIPGVRLVISDGTTLVSDSEGKYSYCGLPPKSHVIRIDESTLPRGSRLTASSNRNLGDAGSLWLDLKNGELHRADFVEGSCSAPVLDQVKARRAQGEVRSVENEKKSLPALRFDSKDGKEDQDKRPRPRTEGRAP